MAIAAYGCVIKTPGIATAFSSEASTQVSGTIYQISDADKRVWDRTVTPTVIDGTGTVAVSSVDYVFGKVTLAAAASSSVKISGTYLPMAERTGINEHRITMNSELGEKTTYENNDGFHRRQPTLNDVTMTVAGLEIPWFNDFTDLGVNTATAMTVASTTVTLNSTAHGRSVGDDIRIGDEIIHLAVVGSSTFQFALTDRGTYGTNIATHSSSGDVFVMNASFYSRNAFLVEVRPGGSTSWISRGWFKTESQDESGALVDLEQNSFSLGLDGEAGASFGWGTP